MTAKILLLTITALIFVTQSFGQTTKPKTKQSKVEAGLIQMERRLND